MKSQVLKWIKGALYSFIFATSLYVEAASECSGIFRYQGHAENHLRIGTFNLLDFDINESSKRRKDAQDIERISQLILKTMPDVMLLQEVRGFESLWRLNHEHLDSKFDIFLADGNDRGRSIGFLIRRGYKRQGQPLRVKLESHADLQIQNPYGVVRRITRDIPAVLLFKKDEAFPFLIVLGVHYRSDFGSHDPSRFLEIRAQRSFEIAMTQKVVKQYRDRFGSKPLILIGGDFNLDLRGEGELDPLFKEFFNPWDLSVLPLSDRFTHVFSKTRSRKEMDGFLVDPRLMPRMIGGQIIRFPSPFFFSSDGPSEWSFEGVQAPSDHDPVFFDFEIP